MASDVTKLRILRGGAYPELSRWAQNTITCILMKEAGREIYNQTGGGDVKVEQRNMATSQGLPAASRSWVGARDEFSPEASNALICKRIHFSS